MFPKCIDELIDSFKKFPGVGQKSAERMAFSLINDLLLLVIGYIIDEGRR